MPETRGYKEGQVETNKALFKQALSFANRYGRGRGAVMDATFFVHDKSYVIIRGLIYHDDEHQNENLVPELIPSSIQPPLVSIDITEYDSIQPLRSSPQGRFPTRVIGADNLVYNFSNTFYLSLTGEAVKLEESWEAGPIEDVLEDIEGVLRVDFIPIETRRYVELDNSDYELLGKIMKQIKDKESSGLIEN